MDWVLKIYVYILYVFVVHVKIGGSWRRWTMEFGRGWQWTDFILWNSSLDSSLGFWDFALGAAGRGWCYMEPLPADMNPGREVTWESLEGRVAAGQKEPEWDRDLLHLENCRYESCSCQIMRLEGKGNYFEIPEHEHGGMEEVAAAPGPIEERKKENLRWCELFKFTRKDPVGTLRAKGSWEVKNSSKRAHFTREKSNVRSAYY